MEKEKEYPRARFAPQVLERATQVLWPSDTELAETWHIMRVEVDGEEWKYDDPSEFFANYRRSDGRAHYFVADNHGRRKLEVTILKVATIVCVAGPDKRAIEQVFEVFESTLEQSLVPKGKPTVFIGHGHSQAWRDLKDHLKEQHGYPVLAYETGARAGHSIRDILESALSSSDFAVLVMTGEDENEDGGLRARQNVVHEAGLFQGRLGFSRAIVLMEEGVESFSNIEGIEQIRFKRGSIRSTFGDVLATLKREFGNDD